jgi:hypothetical protein
MLSTGVTDSVAAGPDGAAWNSVNSSSSSPLPPCGWDGTGVAVTAAAAGGIVAAGGDFTGLLDLHRKEHRGEGGTCFR